ncbi:endonuclease [Pseudomonas phage 8P]|nr:endonuclease [Pseudomonas phage 8P]
MKIHNLIQGSPEWNALRAQHNTASEASAMMGASKKTTRSELLRLKATGSEKEFSEWVQKNLLDNGHAVEANARPIAEDIIGAELFPVTGTAHIGTDKKLHALLASYDGITEFGETSWECKSWNEAKAAEVREGRVPEEDYWQVVQQLVVSEAERCLYMVTDGTEERTVHCWVTLDPNDAHRLLAGWDQFDIDRANYQHVEEKPQVVAEAVEALPVVFVKVSGEVAVQNNFSSFEKALRHFLADKLITDPKTDQDFADLDLQIKAMKKAEEALDAAESQMLAQVQEVDDLKRTKDLLAELVRKNRIASEKLLASQKEKIKLEIRQKGEADFAAHVAQINATFTGGVVLPRIEANFVGAMKNKRTLSSLQDAVSTELARLKIESNGIADKIRANLEVLREIVGEYGFLFRDRQELVMKDKETVELIARQRIDEHQKAEQERLEAERERIRKEEADRLEREAEQRKQAESQAQAAPVAQVDEPQAVPVEKHAAPDPAPAVAPLVPEPSTPAASRIAVANKLALLKAVLAGDVPDDVLIVDTDYLAQLCETQGHTFPGVIWSKA